jgi:uncharacterized protein YjbJ (UPF0337 family)
VLESATPSVIEADLENQQMSAGHISEGKWNQIKGSVKERWGEITDDEYQESEGKLDQLAGKIEEKYGHARRDVSEHLDHLLHRDEDGKSG